MKKDLFILKINQHALELIVRALNKGVYEDVAGLLSDLHTQVQAQLPRPKPVKQAASDLTDKIIKNSESKTNGASRYAKVP